MALTQVKGSAIGADLARQTATTTTMTALRAVSVGDVIQTKEFSTGNGGGAVYDVVLASGVFQTGIQVKSMGLALCCLCQSTKKIPIGAL